MRNLKLFSYTVKVFPMALVLVNFSCGKQSENGNNDVNPSDAISIASTTGNNGPSSHTDDSTSQEHTLLSNNDAVPHSSGDWSFSSAINSIKDIFPKAKSSSSSNSGSSNSRPLKLSQARSEYTVARTKDKIFFAGGIGKDGRSSKNVDIYDLNTRKTYRTSLSQSRTRVKVGIVGTKMFFAGGEEIYGYKVIDLHLCVSDLLHFCSGDHKYHKASNRVDIYDLNSGSWQRKALSIPQLEPSVLINGSTAIFWGASAIDIYDSNKNLWSSETLPTVGGYYSAYTCGTKAIFPSNYTGKVDIFDLDSKTWASKSFANTNLLKEPLISGSKAIFLGWNSPNIVDIYNCQNDSWDSKTLSYSNYYEMIDADSKVIFPSRSVNNGIFSENIVIDHVDVYNKNTNNMSTFKLSRARRNYTVTVVSSKVVLAGGFAADGSLSNIIDICDLRTEVCTQSTFSQPKLDYTITILGKKVIFGNGYTYPDYKIVNSVEILNTDTNVWSKTNLSVGRRDSIITLADSKLIFSPVANSISINNDPIDIFDLETNKITSTTGSKGKAFSDVISTGSKVLFFKDYKDALGNADPTSVEIMDLKTSAWSSITLSKYRTGYKPTLAGRKLILAGGYDLNFIPTTAVDIYDSETDLWSNATIHVGNELSPILTTTDKEVFFGAIHGSNASDFIDVYNFEKNTWNQ